MLGRRTGERTVRRTLARVAAALRKIAGMPDYQEFVDHLRRLHPERPIPSEREFYDQFVRNRYGDGPTRCC